MKRWLFLFACCWFVLPLAAQQASSSSEAAASRVSVPAQASVRFNFDWQPGIPWQSYSIVVQSDGKASFDGTPHPDGTNNTDSYQQDFVMSNANRQKTFELAQKLNFFHGDLDSHLKHIAQTGKKTLQYQSAQVQGSASYNYSQNPDVQQLTSLFQGIALTVDMGRQLAFQYRFDKLGMDKLLRQLEDLEANHNVEELEIIAPMLHKIADDPNLMNISRQSAKHLLRAMREPAGAAQNSSGP